MLHCTIFALYTFFGMPGAKTAKGQQMLEKFLIVEDHPMFADALAEIGASGRNVGPAR